MQLAYKRFSVIAGFAVLLVLLFVGTALTRQKVAVLKSNQFWVEHTQQVLLEITTIESLLKDDESGQRGFLYTGGDERYLQSYDSAVKEIDSHINKLGELTADNPRQQARLPMLRRLAHEKLDELDHTILLFREDQPEEARAIVLSDLGRITMANIRALLTDMEQEEKSLQAERLQAAADSTRSLVRALYIDTGVGMVGLVLLAFFILREMDQRDRHSAEIRQREEWFRVTLGSIGDAVIATDEQGRVIFINPIAEELIGIKLGHAQGQPVQNVFPIFNELTQKPVENPVAKVLQQGRVMGLANHTVLVRSDGKVIPVEDSAAPIFDDRRKLRGVVMVFRDVTQEKQAQDVLRKAEKLAAAGRLAATVAHEINNPLEAVCNLIYLAQHTGQLSEEARGFLKMAEQELDRVSHITRQTLGFYRDSAVPAEVQLRVVVESVLKLYENKLRSKHIAVELDIAECPPVFGWQGELKQLVANLVSNAADAVAMDGRIKISVYPAANHQGNGIEFKVADDGPGVAPENRARIFEPFFTTKEDVGTGLGLWVTKEIAERHGGHVKLNSEKDNGLGGAVFTVFLPYEVQTDVVDGAA